MAIAIPLSSYTDNIYICVLVFVMNVVLISYPFFSLVCMRKQVSPAYVRGTYGSFIQIATCLGLMGALLIGIPVKSIAGW